MILAGGVWIGLALGAVGYVGMALHPAPARRRDGGDGLGDGIELDPDRAPALPLDGRILLRTRISSDMFRGLAPWLEKLPGRLLHTNILGCTIFAAVSGSSAATCATIGKITLPELEKRGYPESLRVGTLAGAATLGFLIPPSIIMIVYGVAAEEVGLDRAVVSRQIAHDQVA